MIQMAALGDGGAPNQGLAARARSGSAARARSGNPIHSVQVDPDKAFAVQISHEEGVVSGPVAYMQCALLYTSSNGERRIRRALPTSFSLAPPGTHLPWLKAWCGLPPVQAGSTPAGYVATTRHKQALCRSPLHVVQISSWEGLCGADGSVPAGWARVHDVDGGCMPIWMGMRAALDLMRWVHHLASLSISCSKLARALEPANHVPC